MSRFNRASSTVQQEKEKIIFNNSYPRTRMGIVKFDSQYNYDNSFDTMDPVTKVAFTPSGGILDVEIDNLLNVYAVGSFTQFRELTNNRIIKLLPNGSKDTSFDNTTGFNGTVFKVYLDTNNKIYCFGSFTTYKGVAANRIIRLNSDGSKDTAFDNTTGFNGTVNDYTVDSFGKIYCVGSFTTYKGVTCNRVARLNTDGSLDSTFNLGGTGFTSTVDKICIDSNNKIYLAGNFTQYNGVSANCIVRLNNDGTIDTGFDYGTGFLPTITINKISVDSSNNLYVSIPTFNSTKYKNATTSYGLWKIDSSGNTINNLNSQSNLSGPSNFYITNDNKIILPLTYLFDVNSTRVYSTNLTDLDGNFIKFISFTSENTKKDSNGNLYMFGTIDNYGFFDKFFSLGFPLAENGNPLINKFNQNFGSTGGLGIPFTFLTKTGDNKLLYGPGITSYNRKLTKNLLKLTLNGSVDNKFDTGTGFNQFVNSGNEFINNIVSDSEGNLYCGDAFTQYKNQTFTNSGFNLIKINQLGDVDYSFSPVNISQLYSGSYLRIQSDNKLLLLYGNGTQFTLSGQSYNGIVRFNTNGSIDNSFTCGVFSGSPGLSAGVSKPTIHTDNKIYMFAGNQPNLKYNGVNIGCIFRLNTDGSLDTTLSTALENIYIENFLIDKYNKIWVWGGFTTYSGLTHNRILRLNNDGSIDNTFNNTTGFNNTVVNCVFDNDTEKLYCSGSFTTYKGVTSRYMISLNYDGTINTNFVVSNKNVFTPNNRLFILDN